MTAPLEIAPAAGFSLSMAEWEARAARLRIQAAEDEIAADEVAEALASFRLRDETGAMWSHDGARWTVVEGGDPAGASPIGRLTPLPYTLEPVAEPAPLPEGVTDDDAGAAADAAIAPNAAIAADTPPPYQATHLIPVSGLPTWAHPDPSLAPNDHLDPGLDVMVLEWRADGWAHIATSNTWTAWIDGRLLDPIEPDPGTPS